MVEMKKADVDKLIRAGAENHVNAEGLEVLGNSLYGKVMVNGTERFFEIKIVAKAADFDQDALDALKVEKQMAEQKKIDAAADKAKKIERSKKKKEAAKKKEE